MSVATDAIDAVQEAVRTGPRVLPRGAGTKPALSTSAQETVALDVSGLTGILEYDPAELTFTALAGTPVAEVAAALAEHGQYLPFDPPLAAAGATLGGVVAAGTSGPGAFRHGGVRDFIVGVRFVDGTGRLVTGGGKVVKNAAGFDLPKLMVGSMGRLGVFVQLSFKVFPRPETTATVRIELGTITAALEAIALLGRGPVAFEAVDLEPPGTLLLRLGGVAGTLGPRLARTEQLVGSAGERLEGDADAALWEDAVELRWVPEGSRLVKVAVIARRVAGLQDALEKAGARARYSLGANVAWVAWPQQRPLEELDAALTALELRGVVLTGPPGRLQLGGPTGGAFAQRVRAALDPQARFEEI